MSVRYGSFSSDSANRGTQLVLRPGNDRGKAVNLVSGFPFSRRLEAILNPPSTVLKCYEQFLVLNYSMTVLDVGLNAVQRIWCSINLQ